MHSGFSWACEYGRTAVVEFMLRQGMDLRAPLPPHKHTGLHWAALAGNAALVELLLRPGAPVDILDANFDANPLSWALHGWSNKPQAPQRDYYDVVPQLMAAGSAVDPGWMASKPVQKDARMRALLTGGR
jgi:hypothetical protein